MSAAAAAMADLFCTFLNYNSPLFFTPKRYYSSALHSHNSRITRIKRSSPHLLLLFKPSPFSASASDIDIISTHEYADGSLLFQFGYPGEIQENVEKEEIEGEDKNESKLMEGDDEAEVITCSSIEASDRANSIVSSSSSSNTVIAVEGEGAFSEKLLKGLDDSNIEMGGISSLDLDINEEYKYSSPVGASIPDESSKIEDSITTVEKPYEESLEETCTSEEMDITCIPVNVEECLNQEVYSSADASIVDQSSEVVDNVTTVALSEKESDGIATSADTDTNNQIGEVEEGVNGDYEDFPVVLDISSEVVNGVSTVALLEKESDGITSTCDIEIEPTENVEESINEVYEDSPVDTSVLDDERSQVLNNITIAASSETETADITFAPDEVSEEPSSVNASIPDKRPEVDNNITVEDFLGKETAEATTLAAFKTDPVVAVLDTDADQGSLKTADQVSEEPSSVDSSILDKRPEVDNNITVEDFLGKETAEATTLVAFKTDPVVAVLDTDADQGSPKTADQVSEERSLVDASIPDKRPEVDNNNTVEDFLGKETAEATTLVAFKTDPVVSVLDTDADQGSLETAVTTNAAPISEHQNVETVIQDEIIGDGRESFDNNLGSPSPQSESAMSSYKETTEEPNLQAEIQDLATEESSETDINNIKAVEMQNVLSNGNESDMYGAEVESPTKEPAMSWSIGSEEQASGSGSGMPNGTVGSENDMIQLLTVPPQLEADSLLEVETATETVEEPRKDDASENQTMGGDLIEESVHEVTALETTDSIITSQEMLMSNFVLSSAAALLPHPSKVLTGGEDACFITGETWFGVADGVSQWSLEGTIPGVYAQELIKNCESLVSDCNANSINNPLELLNLGVDQTHSPGSSTVLLAQFDGQALHVANVGDSGFIVLRHGAVYKRSSPMHHAFSLPVQIERGDDPSSLAQLYRVDLEEEDVIVVATDGLVDNLYDQEISLITVNSLANDKTPEEIAELLAKKAQEVGKSASARSPFADDAQAAGFPGYSGGKLDDVAVIVSVVRTRR